MRYLIAICVLTSLMLPARSEGGDKSYGELFMGLQRPFSSSTPAPKPGTSPEASARAIYTNEVFFHLRNSFPEAITDYLAPCFTPSLLAHFHNSRAEIEKWFEDHKKTDQKLPLGEGSIFISCYEGASNFRIGTVAITGDTAQVTIHLTYSEASITFDWSDVAVFERVSGKWLLTDIKFDTGRRDDFTLRKRTTIDRQ